jgi:hypothetical protein
MAQEAKPLSYAFPDSLKRTLKKGEYACYQLVDVYYKDGKFSGRTAGIPNKDIVYDKEGNLTPIAFVEGYNPDGLPILGNIWFSIESECMILCTSGAKQASLYNFLEVSNYNESNPDRDPNIRPVYRRIDSMNNAKQTRGERTERVAALRVAIGMSNEEIEKFIASNSKSVPIKIVNTPDGNRDWEAMRDGLERWAEKNPARFMSLTESKTASNDDEIKSLIDFGVKENLIGFDSETKSWYGANGKPFLTAKSIKNDIHKSELISYIKSPNGLRIYEKLKEAKKQDK